MKNQKILIVDDEPKLIAAFEGYLKDQPYDLFTATDGANGLDLLRREKIDLAIIDVRMPKMDGLSLLRCIHKENIQTVVLMMTGFGSMELGFKAIKSGAVGAIDKPIMKDEFLTQVKKYMPHQVVWKSWLETFLDNNYNNPDLDFQDLRSYFQISKSHGCAVFKKYVGKTFREKLKEVRIEKAKPLLENTQLQIGEIADVCGFKSSKRLSEAFRQIHGMSPSRYRTLWVYAKKTRLLRRSSEPN